MTKEIINTKTGEPYPIKELFDGLGFVRNDEKECWEHKQFPTIYDSKPGEFGVFNTGDIKLSFDNPAQMLYYVQFMLKLPKVGNK